MTPKTPAERKADERRRLREAGLVAVTVWVLPELRKAVQEFVRTIMKEKKQ
jgi:hypothetical protein